MQFAGRHIRVLTAATAFIAGATLVGCQQSSGPQHAMEEPPPAYRPTMTSAAPAPTYTAPAPTYTAPAPSYSAASSSTYTPPSSSTASAEKASATIAPSSAEPSRATARTTERTVQSQMYYPTGEKDSSVLLIEKSGPAQVRVGQPYNYQIKVTNLTDAPLQGVVVQEALPGSFTVSNVSTGGGAAAAPATQPSDHGAMAMGSAHAYPIGELKAKESRTISVSGSTSQAGALNSCISASYSPTLCTTAMVTNPQMKLLKEAVGAGGPGGGDICQPQVIRYTLTNTGTGDLTGVRVEDPLPNGLTTENGSNRVAFNVGSLAQGQSRAFEVKVKPHQAGQFASAATASADDNVTARSEAAALNIKAPKLQVTVKAPEKQIVGQQFNYEIMVKNIGDAPARSPSLRIAPASEEGAQMAAGTTGEQDLGELAPGATKTINVPFNSKGEGDLKINATATDPCATETEAATASGQTRIAGLPALLLSSVDDHDPVKIGENVTYTITVLNQGFGADKNIKVIATIPDGEEYVSSTGASEANVQGNKITFNTIPNLSAKQTANWTVTVKAVRASDVRFRVDLSSDSFPDAAVKTEPTRLY